MYTVYRIQHKTKNVGPYTDFELQTSDWFSNMHSKHQTLNHPNLWEDKLGDYANSDYVCGFNSLKALKSWFKGFLKKLINSDFIVAKYEVEDYVEGISGKQIMFIPTDFKDITYEVFN